MLANEWWFEPEGGGKRGGSGQLHKLHVVLTTYEMINLPYAPNEPHLASTHWRCLVVDEAHRLKNAESKLTKELEQFSFDHLMLLTGTPLQNNPTELYTLLHFLQPVDFPSQVRPRRRFPAGALLRRAHRRQRAEPPPFSSSSSSSTTTITTTGLCHCGVHLVTLLAQEAWTAQFGDLSSRKHVEKLTAALRPFFLRRMKADVEKSVPPKEETVVQVELTAVQKQWCATERVARSEHAPRTASWSPCGVPPPPSVSSSLTGGCATVVA